MRIGTLAQLWRYPVKSMAGEPLSSARLTRRGIPGDRGWAIFDETRGGIVGGKWLPGLRTCRARYEREPDPAMAPPSAQVTLPDGSTVATGDPDASSRLSEALGKPVSLRALGPPGSATAQRVTAAGVSAETFRALNGVLPDEPLPDLSAFTPELMKELREGNFFDAYPIHLLSRDTLATLAGVAPESDWDACRFRANLLVDVGGPEGYPEIAWVGRRVRIGGAVIEVAMTCPRCVMVTQATAEVPQDHRVMRTLVRETRHTAGIYATVVQEGEVRAGDAIEAVEERAGG